MTRPLLAALAALVLVVVLATGCGEKKDVLEPRGSKDVEVMLDWFPNVDHSEIYAAEADGDFAQAGLKVKIRTPSDPSEPIKQVAAGRVDVAIAYEPEVLRARDKGLRVISVGAIVNRPLTSIISLPKARVRKPADLKGKRVGTAGIDYQTAYLDSILVQAGVDPRTVKRRNVGFNLNPALLTGKVDATLGGYWNYEAVELRLKGRKPRVIPVNRAGVPTYDELVLVANQDALDRDKSKLRAFIGALSRGARALRNDPKGGIQGLLKANPDLDPKLQRAALKVTLPLFFAPAGKPFGYQDPDAWDQFTGWMRDNHLISKTPSARGAFTNELLPGSGL